MIERRTEMKRNQKPGTWLRIIVLSQRLTRNLRILPILFSKPVFYPVSAINAIWIVTMLIQYNPKRATELYLSLSAYQILWWLFGIAIISFFHEIGHISALLHCGGTPGGVGLSIRFFLPRGWSELKGINSLPATERVYVDLGGIYFQLILTEAVFLVNAVWLQNQVLAAICTASVHMALINLIPNQGSDGYWVVKDLFGIEDISAKARALLRKSKVKTEKHGQKETLITGILLIARNIALIYLLTLILFISIAAGKIIALDLLAAYRNMVNCPVSLPHETILQYLSRRLGCIAFLIVALQNNISSILQMTRGKARRPSGEKNAC